MLESSNKSIPTIVAATSNKHKIIEIDAITKDYGLNVISRNEAGVPEDFDVVEDGDTFEENSYKKAFETMKLIGLPSVADDSGLEVDYLQGAPGVYSARYAGVEGESADGENRIKLLDELKDVPWEKRTGRFVSVITLVFPDGKVLVARGECEGHITVEEKGENGFGYDSLFIPEGETLTFGEIDSVRKNQISHRGNALKKLSVLLEDFVHER
jgi:XTP/dITP diphosphohydrolase